jgi:hypothetical protein
VTTWQWKLELGAIDDTPLPLVPFSVVVVVAWQWRWRHADIYKGYVKV